MHNLLPPPSSSMGVAAKTPTSFTVNILTGPHPNTEFYEISRPSNIQARPFTQWLQGEREGKERFTAGVCGGARERRKKLEGFGCIHAEAV